MSEQQPNPYTSGPAGQGGPAGAPGQGDYKWGPGEASYGYPQPYPAAPAYQPTIGAGMSVPGGYPAAPVGGAGFALGDITVAGDQIITPSGPMPLRGAMWNATDFSRTEEKIPPHAIVLAIVFFLFCLLGLLFLLMKEKTTTGYIQVTVTSGGRHHSTMIPAVDANTYHWVMSQLNHARALSM
ncbi:MULTISPECIES: hypothetical protein [Streptomyces]|uniref:hypothetical protein n=1 Tax=Streptomyces TaxID=1883 RepID=UPI0004BD83D8|nr:MULTISPECIES: hypothetical protein [Streptomyces]KJY22618.1 hypothetical protein VR43_04790 [Streptomyces sp. NRRL S-104]KOU44185.1 hypothetical protein ADK53_03265 [Streptomyces sp. WM6373]KOU65197.1 hypothetical protein ADK96_18615 [Streptomyces sp. IGB124]KOU86095.1 hypothetical protein ADK61_05075 [Streptomyces sp. XY66]KOU86706.1 hypothetical protein ADK93_19040 [Streptomyces sp. XY58]